MRPCCLIIAYIQRFQCSGTVSVKTALFCSASACASRPSRKLGHIVETYSICDIDHSITKVFVTEMSLFPNPVDWGVDPTGTLDIPLGATAGRRTPQGGCRALHCLLQEVMGADCRGGEDSRPRWKELPREVISEPHPRVRDQPRYRETFSNVSEGTSML